jgi:hypothetical protein
MEWDGNNKHFCRRLRRKLRDRVGQQLAKPRRNGSQAVVLECMNQLTHSALIGAVCNGPYKGWRRKAASAAKLSVRMGLTG